MKSRFDEHFENYNPLLSPTMAVPSVEIKQHPATVGGLDVEPFSGYLQLTYPISAIPRAAASIPRGCSSDGMPIGLHRMGRRGDEETGGVVVHCSRCGS